MFMKCMFMHGGSLLIPPWFIYMYIYMYLFCAGPPNTISLSELHDNTHGPLHLHVHILYMYMYSTLCTIHILRTVLYSTLAQVQYYRIILLNWLVRCRNGLDGKQDNPSVNLRLVSGYNRAGPHLDQMRSNSHATQYVRPVSTATTV